MKTLKVVFSMMVVATFAVLMSCGGGGGATPAGTAEKFIKSVADGKYDAAIELIAMGDEEMNEETNNKLVGLFSMAKAEMDKKDGLKTVEVVSEEVTEDGETAEVTLKMIYGNDEEAEEDYKLIKEEGDWKIKMN